MKNRNKVKSISENFIESIWNNRDFEKLNTLLHPGFTDHSLPPTLSPDAEGLKHWIVGTGKSFEHKTFIDEQVTEGNKTILKIRMLLKHIGTWRGIEATGTEVSVIGYRYLRIKEDKIIEHWGLIDGNTIENKLKETAHGCKIQI